MTRDISALLLVAFLVLACGGSERDTRAVDDDRNALLNRAMNTLEATPKLVSDEVLKTCDKWRHLDHPCVDEEVRIDQLECWLEAGVPELQLALTRRIGPRARNLNVLMKQNLCMEARRWRKIKSGPDF